MNEYYDILDKYAKDPVSNMKKYTDYMKKYGEFLDATNKFDEKDYSLDDWNYYMKAVERILERASKSK